MSTKTLEKNKVQTSTSHMSSQQRITAPVATKTGLITPGTLALLGLGAVISTAAALYFGSDEEAVSDSRNSVLILLDEVEQMPEPVYHNEEEPERSEVEILQNFMPEGVIVHSIVDKAASGGELYYWVNTTDIDDPHARTWCIKIRNNCVVWNDGKGPREYTFKEFEQLMKVEILAKHHPLRTTQMINAVFDYLGLDWEYD